MLGHFSVGRFFFALVAYGMDLSSMIILFVRLLKCLCYSFDRLLPAIGRQIVMSILYVETPIPLKDIQSWVYKEGHKYVLHCKH